MRLVVIGNPIAHSKSPEIHAEFARQCGIDVQYRRCLAPLDGFEQTVRALRAAGCVGANITVPFKLKAFDIADRLTPSAQVARAVNTLVFQHDGILGHNTDGPGLCADLQRALLERGLRLSDCQLLMLGAGGAAQGCIQAFSEAGVQQLFIHNRTLDKAESLALLSRELGLPCDAGCFESKPALKQDLPLILVNATSASLTSQVPFLHPEVVARASVAVDMMYGAQPTAFMQAVKRLNADCLCLDGLGMLVNQAALSFELWTGCKPDAAQALMVVRKALFGD